MNSLSDSVIHHANRVKVCSKCREEKSVDEFGIDKSKKSGRTSSCKQCNNKQHLKRRRANGVKPAVIPIINKDLLSSPVDYSPYLWLAKKLKVLPGVYKAVEA